MVLMLNVPGVERELCVNVSEDTLAVHTVDLDVVPILVLKVSVVVVLSVKMWVADLSVNVYLDIMVTLTLAVLLENVMRTQIVAHRELVKITNVLTRVRSPVVRVQTVQSRTMSPSAGVPEEQQEIHSETAGDLPEMRSVLLVEQTLTVKLALMTDPSADVKPPTLVTHCRDVVTSVSVTVSVVPLRSVTDNTTDVRMLAAEELVVRMPTVKLSTTELSAPVLLTSWVIPIPDVIQSVPDIQTVRVTKPVSD